MRSLLVSIMVLMTGVQAHAAEGLAKPWQLDFQEPATPVMEGLVNMHDMLLVIITAITIFVTVLLAYTCIRFRRSANPNPSKTTHNTLIEVVWTVVPVLILAVIAWPSYKLHKEMSDIPDPDVTLKIIGYQWYWNYEYPDDGLQFDAYMKQEEDLVGGEPRLLATDYPVVVPVDENVRVLVTGGDVIHNWAMPAFGIKQDTVPGRLNETWFRATKEGTYYGQCSELCGRLHGFMPIDLEVANRAFYDMWLATAKKDMEAASNMVRARRGTLEGDPEEIAAGILGKDFKQRLTQETLALDNAQEKAGETL